MAREGNFGGKPVGVILMESDYSPFLFEFAVWYDNRRSEKMRAKN